MSELGCLLINVGTPDSTSTPDVRKYLQEFLMDPEVINIPYPLRWLLMKYFISYRRAPKTAAKYQKVWKENGSPLLSITEGLKAKLDKALPDIHFAVAMRYGNPSLLEACKNLLAQGCQEIILFPQYPQYARSSTFTAENAAREILRELNFTGEVSSIQPFFDEDLFISAWVEKLKPQLAAQDFFLFTFHGLPQSHVEEGSEDYPLHCVKTAKAIADQLGLRPDQWTYGFQSRLGPVEWIKPYTDHLYVELGQKGVKRLCVCAPSFTADCLETLEEVAMEGKETFLKAGGEKFTYVEALNTDESWINAIKKLIAGAL